jgi:D-amino-acid dehydrogenase
MKSIAVIGGGITGVTTAYALAKRGFAVTLFEKNRYAAMETSFANGGQLSASNAEVWTHWSTILKGVKWMLKSDAPLLVNPKPSWHKLSWFAEFISNIPNYRANTIETARLAVAAREHLFAWAQAEGVDFDLKKEGILHIYRDKKGFDHAGKVSELLAAGGLPRRAVTPSEMKAIEPTLAGTFYGGYFTESDSTGDIHKFTFGMAAASARMGVKCLWWSCTAMASKPVSPCSQRAKKQCIPSTDWWSVRACKAASLRRNWATGSTFIRSRAIRSPSICPTRKARQPLLSSACWTMKPSW